MLDLDKYNGQIYAIHEAKSHFLYNFQVLLIRNKSGVQKERIDNYRTRDLSSAGDWDEQNFRLQFCISFYHSHVSLMNVNKLPQTFFKH